MVIRWKARCPLRLPLSLILTFATAATITPPVITAWAGGEQPRVNPQAQTMAAFEERVADYVALHRKLEARCPNLPKEATPQQIDEHQRALGKLIQQARASAKPGDLFTPAMRQIVRGLLGKVFRGPGGRQVKASILDEYTENAPVQVNSRYPDTVPLSTVPPQVLQNLPTLPEDLGVPLRRGSPDPARCARAHHRRLRRESVPVAMSPSTCGRDADLRVRLSRWDDRRARLRRSRRGVWRSRSSPRPSHARPRLRRPPCARRRQRQLRRPPTGRCPSGRPMGR